jgi:DNA topoisomerase IB
MQTEPTKAVPPPVKKSWADILNALPRTWNESNYPRGKTSPERKAGDWLHLLLKFVSWQPRWPAGTPVDEDTGAGGGRWKPSAEHAGMHFPHDAEGKPIKDGHWLDIQGNPVPPEVEARIKAVGVPPGYTDVVLNDDPEAPNQARAKDSKGRDKLFYLPGWHAKQAAKKWARLRDFHQKIPEFRQRVLKDLQTLTGKDLLAAQVLYALDQTGWRVGGGEDDRAEKAAYGMTTLLSSHVTVDGDKVSFRVPSKSGQMLTKTIDDVTLAKIVTERKQVTRRNQPVFDVSATKVNDYLKSIVGPRFSVKDLRTWHGTSMAIIAMGKWKNPPPVKEFNKRSRQVLDQVSKWLGNTRAVAKSAYVDPALWEWWKPMSLGKI